ncbi:MAG: hypothetical protein PHE25_05870 [Candidatus Gracilibacteria bacterium]|nr:hypothetical protein [Candidatus Gracilibacteria bacterium]
MTNRLKSYPLERLKTGTGNKKIDEIIGELLKVVGDNINLILDDKMKRVLCSKIDTIIKANKLGLSPEVLTEVQRKLKKVRNLLSLIANLSLEIKKCNSIEEIEELLRKKGNSVKLDINLFNHILSKYDNLEDALAFSKKYGKGLNITK